MEKEEIILIDNTIKSLYNTLISIFNYDRYLDKPLDRSLFMSCEFYSHYYNEKDVLLSLPCDEYLLKKIDDLIIVVEKELSKSGIKSNNKFVKLRSGLWTFYRSNLYEIKAKISQEMLEITLTEDASTEKVKLNRSQIALLMIYLRQTGAICTTTSDTLLVHAFSLLTGFSYKTLRNQITGTPIDEKNQITQKAENFDALKDHLNKIISIINQDKKSSILK